MIPSVVPDREIRFFLETLFFFWRRHCGYEALTGATAHDVGRLIRSGRVVLPLERSQIRAEHVCHGV
jgi:hypothetical protein